MVEPPWKRLGAVEIVPEWMAYIKTEKVGMEYGWRLGVLAFKGRVCYSSNDDYCNRNDGGVSVDYLHLYIKGAGMEGFYAKYTFKNG